VADRIARQLRADGQPRDVRQRHRLLQPLPQGPGHPGVARQTASFFCLDNSAWRIIGLDTGYNSAGVPGFSKIPLINRIPFFNVDCHMEQKLLDWLKNDVRLGADKRPTLLLSHHQFFSAFEDGYPKPAEQLAGRDVVWLWGHEHRLAAYKIRDASGAVGFDTYGRCVGHGGMPVEPAKPKTSKDAPPLDYWDSRTRPLPGTLLKVGYNGFTVLTLDGGSLTIEYRDSDNIPQYAERFEQAENGRLTRPALG
jgi:hypothetical protein